MFVGEAEMPCFLRRGGIGLGNDERETHIRLLLTHNPALPVGKLGK